MNRRTLDAQSAKGGVVINRRDLIVTGFTTSTMMGSALAQGGKTPLKLTIEAPEDVYIVQLVPEGTIKKGQLLIKLKSFHLESTEIQHSLYKQQIDIMERPFKDGRIDKEIAMLKQKAESLQDIVDLAKQRADQRDQVLRQDAEQAGLAGLVSIRKPPFAEGLATWPWDLAKPLTTKTIGSQSTKSHGEPDPAVPAAFGGSSTVMTGKNESTTTTTNNIITNPVYKASYDILIELDKSNVELLSAKLAADQADRHKNDALDKIKLAREKLALYETLLVERRKSMEIISSVDGIFIPHITEGFFAKRGHVLGEIVV